MTSVYNLTLRSSSNIPLTTTQVDDNWLYLQDLANAGTSITAPKSITAYYGLQWQAGIGIIDTSSTNWTVGLYALLQNANYGTWLHSASPTTQIFCGLASPNLSTNSRFISCGTTTATPGSIHNPSPSDAGIVDEFIVYNNGSVYGRSILNQLADYAEFFEWKDLNPNNEDRIGYCVVLDDGMIRKYKSTDKIEDILGVISGTGAFIGNSAELYWSERYLTDDFGRRITEKVSVATWTDTNGIETTVMLSDAEKNGTTIPTNAVLSTIEVEVVNPSWKPSTNSEYKSRGSRPEWGIVGLLGQIWVRNDQPIKPEWKKIGKSNTNATLYMIK